MGKFLLSFGVLISSIGSVAITPRAFTSYQDYLDTVWNKSKVLGELNVSEWCKPCNANLHDFLEKNHLANVPISKIQFIDPSNLNIKLDKEYQIEISQIQNGVFKINGKLFSFTNNELNSIDQIYKKLNLYKISQQSIYQYFLLPEARAQAAFGVLAVGIAVIGRVVCVDSDLNIRCPVVSEYFDYDVIRMEPKIQSTICKSESTVISVEDKVKISFPNANSKNGMVVVEDAKTADKCNFEIKSTGELIKGLVCSNVRFQEENKYPSVEALLQKHGLTPKVSSSVVHCCSENKCRDSIAARVVPTSSQPATR